LLARRNSNLQNPVGGSSPKYEMYYAMKVDLALLMIQEGAALKFKKAGEGCAKTWQQS